MSSELVQPILLTKTGYHLDAVMASALASIEAYLVHPDEPAWSHWLSGAFTKTVRRGTAGQFAIVSSSYPGAGYAADTPVFDDPDIPPAQAYALLPCSADELPHPVNKMQVAGFERPRWSDPEQYAHHGHWDGEDRYMVHLFLNAKLGMSTGKSAAQAAHALWMAWILLGFHHIDDIRLVVRETDISLMGPCAVEVHDAGRTEVDPGSRTAIAVLFDKQGNRIFPPHL